MNKLYSLRPGALSLGFLLTALGQTQAQSIVSTSPARHAAGVPLNATISQTFSAPVTQGAAEQVRVFSEQYRGRRAGSTVLSNGGSTATRTLTGGNLRAGETVRVTVPVATAPGGARVYQFTAETAPSPATFGDYGYLYIAGNRADLTTADVDADGDLDLLVASNNPASGVSTISVRLNTGAGAFSGGAEVPVVGNATGHITTADVDGDGDLDLLSTHPTVNVAAVRLNNGAGTFGGGANVTVGAGPQALATGDVDADGDLDLLVANETAGTVSVRYNDGAGNFSGSNGDNVGVNPGPTRLELGDIDSDGDLDFVTVSPGANTVSIGLNNGSGVFAVNTSLPVGNQPRAAKLADVTGDGQLDLLVLNRGDNAVSLRANTGSGSFGPAVSVSVGAEAAALVVADLNGDGRLDLAAASSGSAALSLRLNNGTGSFSNGTDVNFAYAVGLTAADLDGDRDLDLLMVDAGGGVSTALNQTLTPVISSILPASAQWGTTVVLNGKFFTNASAVSFNGLPAISFAVVSDFVISAVVPVGASTGPVTVTTPVGTASADFTVIPPAPYDVSLAPASGPVGTSVTLTGTHFYPPLTVRFGSVAASNVVINTPSELTAIVPAGLALGSTAVTVTTPGGTATSSNNFQVNAPRPTLASFAPGSGPVGTAVTLTGTNFVSPVSVRFNNLAATNVVVHSATSLTATVPAGASTGPVMVYAAGGNATSSTDFTVLPAPTLTAFAPAAGLPGTSVTLTGTHLLNASAVRFNNTPAPGFVVNSATSITVSVPAGATTGPVTVTTPGGTATSSTSFTVYQPPTISGFTPGSGGFFTLVTVTGTNLLGASAVSFNGQPALSFAVSSNTQLVARVAAGTTTGPIRVTTPAGTATSSSSFSFLPSPTISSFSPGSGGAGTAVSITGTHFSGATRVAFEGIDAVFVVNSATSITATVPVGAWSGQISVTTGGGTAWSPGSFTVYPTPVIQTLTPGYGPVGTPVLIQGRNFDNVTAVRFNGTDATFTTNGTTYNIWTTVPAGATTGPLTVTAAGGTATALFEVVQPPTLTGVSPGSGPVGTSVTLTGTHLTYATAVQFNGTNAPFVVNSATSLTATVPLGARTGPVTVTNAAGSGSSSTAFTVVAVPITALSPARNARAAARNTTVAVSFDQAPTAASAANIRVFSAQAGGSRAGSTAVAGTTATRTLSGASLRAGEVVRVSVPATVQTSTGATVAPQVYQFTAASGPGSEVFGGYATVGLDAGGSDGMAAGDIDGDGDLDLVTITSGGSSLINICLNDGTGKFSSAATGSVGYNPLGISLADVDADDDLDLLTANQGNVTLRLNNGGGVYAPATGVAMGSWLADVQAADVDADGDLDLLATNQTSNTVTLRFNDGAGNFSGNTSLAVGATPRGLTLADLDNDGDLDLLTANSADNTVSIHLNAGSGVFAPPATNATVAVGASPYRVAAADVDGDGDLDLLAANYGGSSVSVRLNNGAGGFSGSTNVAVGSGPVSVEPADVDGDGDLDLVTANYGSNTASLRLNNGSGSFSGSAEITAGPFAGALAVADFDNDGDLDLAVANRFRAQVSLAFNQAAAGTVYTVSPSSGPVGTSVSITGANFTGATAVRFNGAAASSFVVNAANSITATVPAGASTGPVTVTGPGGTGASAATFTVLPAPVVSSFTPSSGPVGTSVTITGQNLSGTTAVRFNGTPAIGFVVNSATSITATVPLGASTGPVSVTAPGGAASSSGAFSVLVPAISAFTPTSGSVGTSVSIVGENLGSVTAVRFNGAPAPGFVVNSATSITVTVPAGASSGPVGISWPGGQLNSNGHFTVLTAGALSVTALSPARNARAAPRNTAIGVSFDAAPTAASAANIRVFSAQAGGRRAGTTAVSGNTATRTLSGAGLRPGEVVQVSVPATVQSGTALPARPHVFQFTAATQGGAGVFAGGSEVATGSLTVGTAAADVDADGDLDLLAANTLANTVSVSLNDGAGNFGAATSFSVGTQPVHVVAADLDADGDLDLLTANQGSNNVSVLSNNGAGGFGSPVSVGVGPQPFSVAVGDVDGDGDQDLVTANQSDNTPVSVCLNNGAGSFGTPTSLSLGAQAVDATLADLNGDGDLDLLVAHPYSSFATVLSNDGAGSFGNPTQVSVGSGGRSVQAADVDGDGDLDLVTANYTSNTVSIRPNDGTGAFGPGSDVAVNAPFAALAADVDGDGDLDLLATENGTRRLNVQLNNGAGSFFANFTAGLPDTPYRLAAADVDGDGDLDLLVGRAGGQASVRLNQAAPAPTVALTGPHQSALPGLPITLTGTGLGAVTAVRFNGTPATSFAATSANSLTVTVPAGAGSGPISVTTPAGTAVSAGSFTVLSVYDGPAGQCLNAAPVSSTGSGQWQYLLAPNGQVIAALNDQGTALGTVQAEYLRADAQQPVRRDDRGVAYLDRNWHLQAQNPFPGQSVRVRFFGLDADLARLQAADAGVSGMASLRLTQYSGPAEDCQLANNGAAGQVRLLSPAAMAPAGTGWLALEAVVTDHFSEFYAHGGSRPLPVELVSFSAEARGPAVQLRWRTATERNSARFEVERSPNGRIFTPVGRLPTQANAGSPTTYRYQDQPPVAGWWYYRLRQVDLDGQFSYSPVRTVQAGPAGALTLHPNPARQRVTVQGAPAATSVELLDALGRPVLQAKSDAAGRAELTLPQGLPAGVYIVRSGSQRQRLLVE